MENLYLNFPWGFFDGVSLEEGALCGRGFVLHLYEHVFFHISMGIGQGKNNWDELLPCKSLISFAMEKGCD